MPAIPGDPLIGDLRRAGLLPLLVLHYISAEACYGNQLMERIAALTGGALAVNPNTMYPLLRSLEARASRPASGSTPSAARSASTGSPTPGGPSARGSRPSWRRGWTGSRGSIEAIRGEVLG